MELSMTSLARPVMTTTMSMGMVAVLPASWNVEMGRPLPTRDVITDLSIRTIFRMPAVSIANLLVAGMEPLILGRNAILETKTPTLFRMLAALTVPDQLVATS